MRPPTAKQIKSMEEWLAKGREIGREEGRKAEREIRGIHSRWDIIATQFNGPFQDGYCTAMGEVEAALAPKRKGGKKK